MREMYVGREVVEERRKIRLLQLFKLHIKQKSSVCEIPRQPSTK